MWSHDIIDFEMSLLISVTRPILEFTLKLDKNVESLIYFSELHCIIMACYLGKLHLAADVQKNHGYITQYGLYEHLTALL